MAVSSKTLRLVSAEPALQSLLFDVNMLPEQISTKEEEAALALAAACYMQGKACAMRDQVEDDLL